MHDIPQVGFRAAQPEDARGLAAFQIKAWKDHYDAFLPHWTLDQVSIEDRSEAWRMILRNPARHADTEVHLAEVSGQIAGFGAVGRQRSARLSALGYGGDVSAIYVGRAFQARGLGRRILARLFRRLKAMGETKASLWVIRDNLRARRFMEATGAELLDPGAGGRHHAIDDVAYGWSRIDTLFPTSHTKILSGHDRYSVAARPVTLARPRFAAAQTSFRPSKG
ncbi:MAG: GNAT family N-acetyltransferase [Pseudomonadota bacterium]